jgi:hypothetical protein
MDLHDKPVHDKDADLECNTSANPWFDDVVARRLARRDVLVGGSLLAATAIAAGPALADAPVDEPATERHRGPVEIGFEPIPVSYDDVVKVPPGYRYDILLAEGDPITLDAPPYIPGDRNSGADRELQAGAHHDGMWYFPLARGAAGNRHGLMCINHENIDPQYLHPDGIIGETSGVRDADQVRKEIASHGVSIVEVVKSEKTGKWRVRRRSRLNRRITANTCMEITGPVAGSPFVQTKYDPEGYYTRGTLNNCAMGYTPWGTYLTCEENWAGYFKPDAITTPRPREQTRYLSFNQGYDWWRAPGDEYERFNTDAVGASARDDYRNEANGQGWIVEIDPFDPDSTPKKRTALGRFAHEGAWVAPAVGGLPIVVYSGDDSRGEYMYKFVSRKKYRPGRARKDDLLEDGTLYVAVFNDDGTGEWRALDFHNTDFQQRVAAWVAGDPANRRGFTSQADVLVNTRTAADAVGATRMDRPEWCVIDQKSGYVYLTLTNNTNRGVSSNQPVNAANPRARNRDGHIIRWREDGGRYEALSFRWDIFVFGGPTLATTQALGLDPIYAAQVFPGTPQRTYLPETATFNSPDGCWVDPNGIFWIQTDGYRDPARGMGNQQMLAADTKTGEIRRFLVGPNDCEITGVVMTPDCRTMFVNIQHPGERGNSTWPNLNGETRPRSATIIIEKEDGGVIGT